MKFILHIRFDSRYDTREWELAFEERTGIKLINPFYDIVRQDFEQIDMVRAKGYEKLDYDALVKRDLEQINKADGTLALVNGMKSFGTIMEMFYTKSEKYPLYSVITNGEHNHPWLKYVSTDIFRCLGDFEKFISRPCDYKCGGMSTLAGRNDKENFKHYTCNDCGNSWMDWKGNMDEDRF